MGERLARRMKTWLDHWAQLAAHSPHEIQYKGISPGIYYSGTSLTPLSLTWNAPPPVCGQR